MSDDVKLSLPAKMACWAVGSAGLFAVMDAPTEVIVGALTVVFCLGLLRHMFDKYSTGVTDEEIKADDLKLLERARLLRNRPGKMTQAHPPRLRKGGKSTYRVEPFDPKKHK